MCVRSLFYADSRRSGLLTLLSRPETLLRLCRFLTVNSRNIYFAQTVLGVIVWGVMARLSNNYFIQGLSVCWFGFLFVELYVSVGSISTRSDCRSRISFETSLSPGTIEEKLTVFHSPSSFPLSFLSPFCLPSFPPTFLLESTLYFYGKIREKYIIREVISIVGVLHPCQ